LRSWLQILEKPTCQPEIRGLESLCEVITNEPESMTCLIPLSAFGE
jgi:hypothetical protein